MTKYVRSPNLLHRFLLLVPFVVAMGAWLGHLTLRSSVIESHPEYPVSCSSILATLPECPEAVLAVPEPVPMVQPPVREATEVPEQLSWHARGVRGPPLLLLSLET